MRGRVAPIAAAAAILVLILVLFVSAPKFRTLSSAQPVQGHRPYTGWPDPAPWHPPQAEDASGGDAPERLVVKLKLEGEDTSWIPKLEPAWRNDVIAMETMWPHAHPKAHRPDKGRVASAYLRWIIENYNHLPETTVFLPPADTFDKEKIDLGEALSRLQIPFVHSSGYANLHCPTSKSLTTCNDKVLNVAKASYEFRVLEAKIRDIWTKLFDKEVAVPERLASVLGAEFVVSREQVRKRSVDEYLRYWTWLQKTIMDDDSSGLVFEYLWHVVFGKDAVFCPDLAKCECDLYGSC